MSIWDMNLIEGWLELIDYNEVLTLHKHIAVLKNQLENSKKEINKLRNMLSKNEQENYNRSGWAELDDSRDN